MAKSDGGAEGVPAQVLFLSSVDWGAAWQRHHAWAERFASSGREVFFVENTGFRGLRLSDAGRLLRRAKAAAGDQRQPSPGVRVIAPLTLPPTAGAFRRLNRHWLVPRLAGQLRRAGLRPGALAFAYLPTDTTLALLDALEPSRVVYDCVDHFAGHPDPPPDLAATEAKLLGRACCVVVTSPFLRERQAARHPRVYELHHGVEEPFFSAVSPPPREYRSFCYFGSLWSAIDFRYVEALAEAGFEVALIGPAREPLPPLAPGVRHLPALARERLPGALAPFDALLLPYADTPYNQGVVPAKTYECLATGKPVLASPLPGLARFRDCFYLEREPQGWVRIARRLGESESAQRRHARVSLAREHSAAAQFEKLLRAIQLL